MVTSFRNVVRVIALTSLDDAVGNQCLNDESAARYQNHRPRLDGYDDPLCHSANVVHAEMVPSGCTRHPKPNEGKVECDEQAQDRNIDQRVDLVARVHQ